MISFCPIPLSYGQRVILYQARTSARVPRLSRVNQFIHSMRYGTGIMPKKAALYLYFTGINNDNLRTVRIWGGSNSDVTHCTNLSSLRWATTSCWKLEWCKSTKYGFQIQKDLCKPSFSCHTILNSLFVVIFIGSVPIEVPCKHAVFEKC
jgi:hypothetical protein